MPSPCLAFLPWPLAASALSRNLRLTFESRKQARGPPGRVWAQEGPPPVSLTLWLSLALVGTMGSQGQEVWAQLCSLWLPVAPSTPSVQWEPVRVAAGDLGPPSREED